MAVNGTFTVEFPHIVQLIKHNQFDTIYHEHFSYLSLKVLVRICKMFNLTIYHVETLKTHGGSLRVWISKKDNIKISKKVEETLLFEDDFGIENIETYITLQTKAESIKKNLIEYLLNTKKKKVKVAGYGAAAKANTLLNFSGIKDDLIPFIADKSISKQNLYMPGSHIPIVSPEKLIKSKINDLIVFPWNLINEISNEYKHKNLITFIPFFKSW